MKLKDIIKKIKSEKPSQHDDISLLEYINEAEGIVQKNIYRVKQEDLIKYSLPDDAETELLAKEPFHLLYVYYVGQKIDYVNRDIDGYNQNADLYNTIYGQFGESYMRENKTSPNIQFKNYM